MVSCELFVIVVTMMMLTCLFSEGVGEIEKMRNLNGSDMELPNHSGFSTVAGCSSRLLQPKEEEEEEEMSTVKIQLKRRSAARKSLAVDSTTAKDLTRIQTLHKRMVEKKNRKSISSRLKKDGGGEKLVEAGGQQKQEQGQLMATIESGVSLGSGEYFMDVFVGTPPKHYSLILDTGSDLNWIQCVPCYDCFQQNGPYYDPKLSTSFRNISCDDPRCELVSSPSSDSCNNNNTCPYFYWYGDSSNTTGDLALETFTINLTTATRARGREFVVEVENVIFGCGHWNRGLFHGASGLLGLGRGPLSFSSQLQSVYGHNSFSYCLVERNSDASVSSKFIFGQDKQLLSHPLLNFTSFVGTSSSEVDTFYYLHIKSILVGGEALLNIPEETWNLSPQGVGGTIIDSGTTLSYFAQPAYEIMKEAFVNKLGGRYPVLEDFPILNPCYNVSEADFDMDIHNLPTFGIVFADGALWNFPPNNYLIRVDQHIVCLAMLGTPRSALSIIGNYQQQNFHILYDTNKSRLGFAPTTCAHL